MQTKIHEPTQIVEVMLTHAEQADEEVKKQLKELYAQYKGTKYTVAVFLSGKRDLYEDTRDLLLFNRRRAAERAVQALLAAGYRRPLCLHLPANHLATVRRRQGLERACRGCALPLPATEPDGALCGACQGARSPLAAVHAALLYAAPADGLLRRFKFHGDLAAGRLLAQLMHARLAPVARPQALVPVPLHLSRLRRRGYDQALELARPLARRFDLPLRTAQDMISDGRLPIVPKLRAGDKPWVNLVHWREMAKEPSNYLHMAHENSRHRIAKPATTKSKQQRAA